MTYLLKIFESFLVNSKIMVLKMHFFIFFLCFCGSESWTRFLVF